MAVFIFVNPLLFCIFLSLGCAESKRGLIVLGMIIISASANAAPVNQGLCDMITKFQEVFKLLRTLAFVGAGFILAKYGWDAISSGKLAGSDNVVDGLKKIG